MTRPLWLNFLANPPKGQTFISLEEDLLVDILDRVFLNFVSYLIPPIMLSDSVCGIQLEVEFEFKFRVVRFQNGFLQFNICLFIKIKSYPSGSSGFPSPQTPFLSRNGPQPLPAAGHPHMHASWTASEDILPPNSH